ncbi:TULIP family P47-like protein [Bacillus cereus]|uniref:TULIP family P47-like protein n=1 Tax=Bacillus cereus TaxID=1396 RepID=UPI00159716B6|nr:TULIP family P47-like protein [Bacillus cereus]
MNKKSLDSLRIYEWNETINDERNADKKNLYEFPRLFQQEIKDASVHAKFTGVWGDWKITDESYGQYPVLKCYITKGTLEVDINNQKNTYNLQNTWIKVCIKIEKLSEEYIVPNKEGSIYCVNYGFPVSKKDEVLSTLIKELILTWFQKNSSLISKYINSYIIHYRTSNDLTLGGWDTNYATSFLNVNNTIKNQGLYPQKFYKKFKDESLGATLEFNMDGNFDSWEMTTGADGQNVNFICKIGEKSSFTNETAGTTYEFDTNAYIKIQLKLEYFNSEEKTIKDPTGIGDGYQKNLKVKSSYDNKENPPVIIISQYFSKILEMNKILESILITMFKEWYIENISEFETIFSYFLLEETAKDENFQWLKPTTAYYGVSSVEDENGNPNLDKSVFSVMAMVENHKNENPQHLVDARLLQAVEKESAFGIDMPLFVEKWLKTGLLSMQLGTPELFKTTKNGLFITNTKSFKFGTITNANEKNVPAYINPGKFKLGITNNQIVLELEDLYWEQAIGLNGHVNYKQSFDIGLKSGVDKIGKDYKNVLLPTENSEPTMLITYTVEEWRLHRDLIIEVTTGFVFGVIVGFIPFGKIFGKFKKIIGKAFSKSGNRMSVNVTPQMQRSMIRDIPLDDMVAARNQLVRESMDETTTFIRPGSTGAEYITEEAAILAAREIANRPSNIFSKIWRNKDKLVGGLIAASIAGTAAGLTPYIILKSIENSEKKMYSELPTINEFMNNCVGAIEWPENSEFDIEIALLQGIYLMGGTLNKPNNNRF